MIKSTTARNDSEKSEQGGTVNVAGRWRNGYKSGVHNGGDSELKELHKTVEELSRFSDELRLGQTLREEQIRTLRSDIDRVAQETAAINLQYQKDKAAIWGNINALKTDVAERINALRTDTTLALTNAKIEITAELDKGLHGLDQKFDDNKNYFTRYFIIILVTILTGLVVGGAAFILNR